MLFNDLTNPLVGPIRFVLYYYLNRYVYFGCWSNIAPKLYILQKMSCVITWDDHFWPPRLWRPKTLCLDAHFGTQRSVHPTAPVLLTKDSIRNEIRNDFQPPFSLHISNSRTKLLVHVWIDMVSSHWNVRESTFK